MRACIHAAIILPGTEQDPETSAFHSVDEATGREGVFKQLQGLQCKSQGNMLKSGSAAFPPINTHTAASLQATLVEFSFFILSHFALKSIKCNMKASYDFNLVSLRSLIFFASGSVLKMFHFE